MIASSSSPSRIEALKADRLLRHVGRAGIGRHDQDDVPEIDVLAVMIGQLAVIHDLQQDVEQVGMGFLDLVQQQHLMGMLIDRIGQQAALVEPDIAWGRADQPADGMPLHIFRHVEAGQLDAKRMGQLARNLRLADPGRAGEQIGADRLFRIAEAGAGKLDGAGERVDRLILAEDQGLERGLQIAKHLLVVPADALGRDARDLGDHRLDILEADRLASAVLRQQHLRRAHFVDHVDRLVRQFAVGDIARRQLDRRPDRLGRIANAMVLFVIGFDPHQDLDRILD